jgi:hypothetical protein
MKPDYSTIEKFRKIYLDEFGEEISQREAYERFLRLINVLRVIFDMPDPDWSDKEAPQPESATEVDCKPRSDTLEKS